MSHEPHMARALELAARGQGHVEPNPMVGCVVVRGDQILAEGWHRRFGGSHAEVAALQSAAEKDLAGATMYVTLEPCCHHGKTPPCTDAILAAGLSHVVVAMIDPFAQVNGEGIRILKEAGCVVTTGILEAKARWLNAPYLKQIEQRVPWVIAKWAMTLDGKIASQTGDSQWISGKSSREIVHQIRGRVDAVMVGRKTVERDDPLLTARPAGPRVATRIVLDSKAEIALTSRLVQTARDAPVLVAAGPRAAPSRMKALRQTGCEVWQSQEPEQTSRLRQLLGELGRRHMTNLLVEGGGHVLGRLADAGQIDEVNAFVAPVILGGADATPAFGGDGKKTVEEACGLVGSIVTRLGNDIWIRGRLAHRRSTHEA